MEININDTSWHEIPDLENDKVYILQSTFGLNGREKKNIIFTRRETQPLENDFSGFVNSTFKFKKTNDKVFVKSTTSPIHIYIEEVE